MKRLSLFFLACAGIAMLGGCGKDMTYNPYDRDWQEPVVQTFAPITSSDDRAKADTTFIALTGQDLVGVSRITIGGLPIPTTTVNLKALTALVTGQYYLNSSPNPANPLLSLFSETVVVHSWKDPEVPLYIVPDFKIEWWHKPPKVTGVYIDADDAGPDPTKKLPDAKEQLAGAHITILGENLETVREINFGPNVKVVRDLAGAVSGTEIVVTIPDHPSWQPGNNPVDISLNYGYPATLVYTADNYEADNTPEGKPLPAGFTGMRGFKVVIPVVTGTTHTQAGLNEMVELEGEGLNFIKRITVEGVELPIVEEMRAADGSTLPFQIVYREGGYPFESGSIVDIIGYYHDPVRTLNLLEDFQFFTDIANVEPFMDGFTSTHKTADGSVYVNGPAVITGTQLNGVTAITVGGERATMAPYGNTPVKLSFNLPRTLKFVGQQDFPVVATWGPNFEQKEIGTIRVNPILLGVGLRLGGAAPPSSLANWRYQVLVPDSARVLTGDEFVGAENPTHNGTTASGTSVLKAGKPRIDQPGADRIAPFGVGNTADAAGNGTLVRYGTIGSATDDHTVTTNWLNKTGRTVSNYQNTPLSSAVYYSVPPYGMLHKGSSGTDDTGLEAPGTNYLGMFRTILTDGRSVWSIFGGSSYNTGTPLVSYRTLSSSTTNAGTVYNDIKSGLMTDLNTGIVYDETTTNLFPSHSRRNIGVTGGTPKGSTPLNDIFLMSYISYQHDGGAAVTNAQHILKTGYIIIKNTSILAGTESAASHLTWIEFDLYWPLEDRPNTIR